MIDINSYKHKYDLHVHTSPVSPCGDFSPEEVVKMYKDAGFTGIVIANHFQPRLVDQKESLEEFVEYFLNDYREGKKYGDKFGIDVILGIEIRFPQNINDYLVYGVSEEDVYKAGQYIYTDYETFYSEFKNDKNLVIQAHPFRDGCTLQNPDILDGIEIFNMHPGHNPRVGFAARTAKEHPHLLRTGGTDFHHDGHQAMCAFCTEERLTDSFSLADAIKSRNYILDVWGHKILPYSE